MTQTDLKYTYMIHKIFSYNWKKKTKNNKKKLKYTTCEGVSRIEKVRKKQVACELFSLWKALGHDISERFVTTIYLDLLYEAT